MNYIPTILFFLTAFVYIASQLGKAMFDKDLVFGSFFFPSALAIVLHFWLLFTAACMESAGFSHLTH